MATIPREALDYVTREVNGVSAEAQAEVMRVLERIDWSDITAAREIVVQAVQMALANATTLAAQASADFYDAARELIVGAPMGATAISEYDPEKTDKAIRSFVRFIERGEFDKFNDQVLQRMDYEVKRSTGVSVLRNGAKDPLKPKFARVPQGAHTCDFCLMLASRGFAYTSESAASNELDHYHSDCDCKVVPSWDGSSVADYDPDALYDEWQGNLHSLAKERAERKGTTEKEEYDAIMKSYGNSAKNAKRRKSKTTAPSKPKSDVDASGMSAGAVYDAVSEKANGKTVKVSGVDFEEKNGGIVALRSGKPIDESDFFTSTSAVFKPAQRPDRDPDYESGSGSRYWYQDGGVYRESDHWGSGVASCNWAMEGRNEFVEITGGKYGFVAQSALADDAIHNGVGVGFCKFEDFARVDDVLPTTAYMNWDMMVDEMAKKGYEYKDYDWYKDGKKLRGSSADKADELKRKIIDKSKSRIEYVM